MAPVSLRNRLLIAVGCAVTSFTPAAPSQSSHLLNISAVRFWSFGDVTRVAIETSGEAEYRSDQVTNPDRIFFDLSDTQPRQRKIEVIPVGDKLLKQIRIAETQPGVTRIVLDLASPVTYTASKLTSPNRLVIELRSAAPQATFEPPARSSSGGQQLTEPAAEPPVAPSPAAATPPPAPAASTPPPSAATTPPVPAKPASRNKDGGRSLTRALGLKVGRVVLDPGHGGHDTGTIGPGGLMEKDLVLDVAKRLGALIEERLGSQVIYTRSDDTFVPLEERTKFANDKEADLFLSIHANSSRLRSTAGIETYYLNFTTSRDAMDVAARENAGSQKTVHELQDLLKKIALEDKVEESKEFASRVQTALWSSMAKDNSRLRNRGVRKAPFVVLIGASMPSVLTEIDFLSNPREEALLKKATHRERIAEALYKGLSQYANTLSHFQVAEHTTVK
jgi:N-acetylmuramoyl-L-alanine amidase